MRSGGARMLAGALSGLGGTAALSVLRDASQSVGLVSETAPQQVLERAKELGFLDDLPERGEGLVTLAAHYGYGTSAGAAFGLLRRETGTLTDELATGAALGVLAWAAGWAFWLPLAGIHSSPWTQKTPRVLLPILDHAAFGAAWGCLYFILRENEEPGD